MNPQPPQLVDYCDWLARKNSEALSFIPRPMLEHYAEVGQIVTERENGEMCGFLIFGNGWPTLRIYQACVQYDARHREHGVSLVKKLIAKAAEKNCEGISLKCASDLEANEFWKSLGFIQTATLRGGNRRLRNLNAWYLPLWPTLL